MILTQEMLIEFEDVLNAIDELAGIEPSAINEVRDAVMAARIMIDINQDSSHR